MEFLKIGVALWLGSTLLIVGLWAGANLGHDHQKQPVVQKVVSPERELANWDGPHLTRRPTNQSSR